MLQSTGRFVRMPSAIIQNGEKVTTKLRADSTDRKPQILGAGNNLLPSNMGRTKKRSFASVVCIAEGKSVVDDDEMMLMT